MPINNFELRKIKFVFLPNHGVVTSGRPEVSDVFSSPHSPYAKDHILHVAASALATSAHPLAGTVLNHAENLSIPYDPYGKIEYLPGLGVEAHVSGISYLVGSRRLLEQKLVRVDALIEIADKLAASGKSVLFVATDGTFAGLIGITDEAQEEYKNSVNDLHSLGVSVVLLGEDHRLTLNFLANKLGIERVSAELSHDEARDFIRQHRREKVVLAAVNGSNFKHDFLEEADYMADSLADLVYEIRKAREYNFRKTHFTREEIIYKFITFAIIALVLYPIFDIYIRTVPALSAGILTSLAVQLGSYLAYNY